MSMDHETVTRIKKQLRRSTLERIAVLDETYRTRADEQIRAYLLGLEEYRQAAGVFCFVGMDHEIDTRPFLEQVLADGKELYVPLCTGRRQMQARRITSLAQLKEGTYGILEPAEDTPVIPPERISLAVIPCVTCAHDGRRLGHGGGFYDTYFAGHEDIPSVMICREQIICSEIPVEAHDLRFRTVVTEAGVFRT